MMRFPPKRCFFISAFAMVLIAGSGCTNRLTAQQRTWLEQAQRRYALKDYSGAIQNLDRVLAEVREGPQAARALYLRGMSSAQAGRRTQAYADLHRCVRLPDDRDAVWRAYVVLGTLYFEDQRWQESAESLRAAADRMPSNPPKDAVLYRLGLCCERSGRWQAARAAYSEIVASYPTSGYTDAARRRWRLKADHFAVQCGAFRQRENAETSRATLRRKGLDAYIQNDVRGRVRWYVVLVGRYGRYEHALSQLALVRQSVPDAILWP